MGFGEARPTTAQGRPNGPLIGWGFSMDEGGSEIPPPAVENSVNSSNYDKTDSSAHQHPIHPHAELRSGGLNFSPPTSQKPHASNTRHHGQPRTISPPPGIPSGIEVGPLGDIAAGSSSRIASRGHSHARPRRLPEMLCDTVQVRPRPGPGRHGHPAGQGRDREGRGRPGGSEWVDDTCQPHGW